ncbi:MAG: RHS repeat domain-containing protein [Candidatus Lariskella arthropodorum]
MRRFQNGFYLILLIAIIFVPMNVANAQAIIQLGTLNYNAHGQVTKTQSLSGGNEASYYNKYDLLTRQTVALGNTVCNYYNDLGQLMTSVVLSKGLSQCPPLAAEALEVGIKSDNLQKRYDPKTGRVVDVIYGEDNKDLHYNYYSTGTIKSITYPDKKTVTSYIGIGISSGFKDISSNNVYYYYDQNTGLIKTVVFSSMNKLHNEQTHYSYDNWGRVSKVTLPNSLMLSYAYDAQGRMMSLSYSNGLRESFIYDSAQNAAKRNDNNLYQRIINDPQNGKVTETFIYDNMNRLHTYNCQSENIQLCPNDEYGDTISSQNYFYSNDGLSNLMKIEETIIPKLGLIVETKRDINYEYRKDKPTQLSNLTYDAAGNVIKDAQGDAYTYSPFNQMRSAKTQAGDVSYIYDGTGHLSQECLKDRSVNYYSVGGKVINEMDNYGNISSYFDSLHGRIAKYINLNQQGKAAVYYYLNGFNGNVLETLNSKGDIMNRYTYSPYGITTDVEKQSNPLDSISDIVLGNSIGFNGQWSDPYTQFQFLGNGVREYDPKLRHFLQYDSMSPFGKGGVNGYAYADGNPIMLMDPNGHMSTAAKWGVNIFSMLAMIGIDVVTGGLLAPESAAVESAVLADEVVSTTVKSIAKFSFQYVKSQAIQAATGAASAAIDHSSPEQGALYAIGAFDHGSAMVENLAGTLAWAGLNLFEPLNLSNDRLTISGTSTSLGKRALAFSTEGVASWGVSRGIDQAYHPHEKFTYADVATLAGSFFSGWAWDGVTESTPDRLTSKFSQAAWQSVGHTLWGSFVNMGVNAASYFMNGKKSSVADWYHAQLENSFVFGSIFSTLPRQYGQSFVGCANRGSAKSFDLDHNYNYRNYSSSPRLLQYSMKNEMEMT